VGLTDFGVGFGFVAIEDLEVDVESLLASLEMVSAFLGRPRFFGASDDIVENNWDFLGGSGM
jgi:hypothetical protein